jgi:hypothetical protein
MSCLPIGSKKRIEVKLEVGTKRTENVVLYEESLDSPQTRRGTIWTKESGSRDICMMTMLFQSMGSCKTSDELTSRSS